MDLKNTDRLKIHKIHSVFFHQNQDYILFSLKNSVKDFLYFQNADKTVRALFFGDNFQERIPQILKTSDTECIECNLGRNIVGGISNDSNDQVDFGIQPEEANKILDLLKNHPTLINFTPDYFDLWTEEQ